MIFFATFALLAVEVLRAFRFGGLQFAVSAVTIVRPEFGLAS
jgi:hypothetical protein